MTARTGSKPAGGRPPAVPAALLEAFVSVARRAGTRAAVAWAKEHGVEVSERTTRRILAAAGGRSLRAQEGPAPGEAPPADDASEVTAPFRLAALRRVFRLVLADIEGRKGLRATRVRELRELAKTIRALEASSGLEADTRAEDAAELRRRLESMRDRMTPTAAPLRAAPQPERRAAAAAQLVAVIENPKTRAAELASAAEALARLESEDPC